MVPLVILPKGVFHVGIVLVRDSDDEAIPETSLNEGGVVLNFILEDFLIELIWEILYKRLRNLIELLLHKVHRDRRR